MKAINSFGPQDVRLVEVTDPYPGPEQVLIAVKGSGICGSDKWLWWHEQPTTFIAGHEVAGEVVAVGAGVQKLQPGDRVAVNNVVSCGACPACQQGAFVLCPYWTGQNDVNGGFAELVAAPERNCLLLDDAIDYVTGALIFDNLGTPYHAVQRAGVAEGDHVVVSGCGPIGLGTVIFAKLAGATVTALDPLPYRREMARSLGADAADAPSSESAAAIREAAGGIGPHVFIECSGRGEAYHFGLSLLRQGGVFTSVGEHARFELHPSDQIIRKALDLRGSWYSTMPDGARIQELILRGKVNPQALVSHTAPLSGFPALFKQVCEFGDRVVKAVIIEEAAS
jgi:threonine dehydrogenase-like Zn-dependent dehydrogenase